MVPIGCGDENGYGKTPLHYAASIGQKEIAKLLISEGADVDSRDEDVLDAFGRVEMSSRTPLQFALFGGHVEIAELLIASGADVNANTYITGTSLHWAAAERKKEIV